MARQPLSGDILENERGDPNDCDGIKDYLIGLGLDPDSIPEPECARGKNLVPHLAGKGHFSFGLPTGFSSSGSFVNDRFYWFPQELPVGASSVFIGSSRLKQDLENIPGWFDALRTFSCRSDSNQFLITATKTTTDRYVKRLGELFQIPVLEFRPFPEKLSLRDIKTHGGDDHVCYFSPQIGIEDDPNHSRRELDRLLILAADQARLLSVRGNGNTYDAVTERLRLNLDTRVLIDPMLTPPKKLNRLLDQGARGWWIYEENRPPTELTDEGLPEIPYLSLTDVDLSNYLLHWTRRRVGKWPDQPENEYLDDLIFGSSRANHDPLAALCRILATDRIMASCAMTRHPTPVVCLSEVTVDRLPDLQVFRSHLARWDFLPYGIALDRQCLVSLGSEKVIYGDEQTWNSLPRRLKPLFQLATSGSRKIDWQLEKEWRLVGDMDLRQIGHEQAFVFVPNHDAARVVSAISRWPVVVLDCVTKREKQNL